MERPIALVTGASSGIGRAFCNEIANDQYDLIISGTNLQALETAAQEIRSTYKINVEIIPQDLSENDGALKLFNKIKSKNIDISLLVNNAGVGWNGDFWDMESENIQKMLSVNIVNLTQLTRLLLPHMVSVRKGCIINISSVACFQPGPGMAIYYASKSYVTSFSQALYQEVKKFGIKVTAVCPGSTTNTNFFSKTRFKQTRLKNNALIHLLSSEKVAKIGYRAAQQGKKIVVTGYLNRFYLLLAKLLPTRIKLLLMYYINVK